MKRILKFKKIRSSNNAKKVKKKKTAKNKQLMKKFFLKIGSPHNTNDYLINENSSPFWNDENDEDSINITPYTFINIGGEVNTELDLLVDREISKLKINI